LQSLANEITLNKAMPELSSDEVDEIAAVFRKLPIVSFLQSGMNSVGRFSLNRVIDQQTIITMSQEAVSDFMKKIDEERDFGRADTLNEYWNAFINANKRYDARGKNYVIQTDGKGVDVTDITEAMFIKTNEANSGVDKVFDPAFIDENGKMIETFSRPGDELTIVRTNDNIDSTSTAIIDNVVWDGSRVIITATNPKTDKTFEFQYNKEGDLTQHTQANGVVKKNPKNIKTSAKITEDLIKVLSGKSFTSSKVGDTVDIKFNINGSISVSQVEILELEDLGYKGIRTQDGAEYNSAENLFYVKLRNNENNKEYKYMVNENGEALEMVSDSGAPYVPKFAMDVKISATLPKGRMQGDTVVGSVAEAEELFKNGVIPAGTWVDVLTPHPTLKTTTSTLGIIDPTSFKFTPVATPYEEVAEEEVEQVDEDGEFFLVYNGVVKPGVSLANEGSSATAAPGGRGKIDLKDRYIHHGLYNNKVGLISRLSYRGGQMTEFITDDVDPVTGVASVNPEIKQAIDQTIEEMLLKQQQGYNPVFSKAGYGQYMIGANDTTNEIIGDPVAKETFIYLSKQLLENFGYINPNFIKKAEGLKEVVRVTNQPVSDDQFRDMMNKCFNL